MREGIGVAGVVALGEVGDALVVGVLVAVVAIEPPPRRALRLQPLGLHIAAAEADVAVLELEHARPCRRR